jgi:hypothetical protein
MRSGLASKLHLEASTLALGNFGTSPSCDARGVYGCQRGVVHKCGGIGRKYFPHLNVRRKGGNQVTAVRYLYISRGSTRTNLRYSLYRTKLWYSLYRLLRIFPTIHGNPINLIGNRPTGMRLIPRGGVLG